MRARSMFCFGKKADKTSCLRCLSALAAILSVQKNAISYVRNDQPEDGSHDPSDSRYGDGDSMTLSEMSGATFSEDRAYRQLLWRVWEENATLLNVIGLNPSKAGEIESDPTITRQIERAKRLRCGGLLMTNAYDLVATDPKDMKRHERPLSSENDKHIIIAADRAIASGGYVLCAWGRNCLQARQKEILRLLAGWETWCLGENADGTPIHPLYISYDVLLQRWPA